MPTLVPIVEGDGEVEAVPLLLRRLLHEVYKVYDVQVARPKNAHGCGRLTAPGGIERFVRYALSEPTCDGVLVLIDNDAVRGVSELKDNCAPALAHYLARRIRAIRPAKAVGVVVARWEYEAWFLASLETIAGQHVRGHPGLAPGLVYDGDVERIHSAKGWIEQRYSSGQKYSETRDQVAMTQLLDLERVTQRSRSFRRLHHSLEEFLEATNRHARGQDAHGANVTPLEPNEVRP